MTLSRIRRITRKVAAKCYYSLPGLVHKNPRSNITSLTRACKRAESLSASPQDPDVYVAFGSKEIVHRLPPVTLSKLEQEEFLARCKAHQQELVFTRPETRIALMRDAHIYSDDLLVFNHSRTLLEESIPSTTSLLKSGYYDTIIWPRAERVKGSHLVLSTAWSRNYYHWLFDALPRLSIIESLDPRPEVSLIVHANVPKTQSDTLEALGISSTHLTPLRAGHWCIDRLYYVPLLAHSGNVAPEAVSWLREKFLHNSHPSSRVLPFRKLYISRQDATGRRVKNESELIEALIRRGFEVVCPGKLCFTEQVRVFSEAVVIVGPHGAGLSNTVFCDPGSSVVELFGTDYVNGCFWALSNLCRHHHGAMICPSDGLDLTAPVDDVIRLIDLTVGKDQAS